MAQTEVKEKKKGAVKGFFSDFKKFITKGNIVDLAIAVVVGGAFGKIVSSLVNDIIMPLITLAVGGVSVAEWKWVIKDAVYENGVLVKAESALTYGNFFQTIIDFVIIAFFIFLALRILMKIQSKLAKIEDGIVVMNNAEHKAFVKDLKNQGKKHAEIKQAVADREAERTALKKAEEDAKKAEEEANKPPTSEQLLADIRDLLKEQSQKPAAK